VEETFLNIRQILLVLTQKNIVFLLRNCRHVYFQIHKWQSLYCQRLLGKVSEFQTITLLRPHASTFTNLNRWHGAFTPGGRIVIIYKGLQRTHLLPSTNKFHLQIVIFQRLHLYVEN